MLRRRMAATLALTLLATVGTAAPAAALEWYPRLPAGGSQLFAGLTADGTVLGVNAYVVAQGVTGEDAFEIGLGETQQRYSQPLGAIPQQFVTNADGDAIAATVKVDGGTVEYGVVERRDGQWGAFRALAGATGELRVAVAPDGRAAAAWAGFTGSEATVEVATRTASGVWSAPRELAAHPRDESGGYSAFFVPPELAFDASGGLTVAWHDNLGEAGAAHRTAGGTWGPARTLGGAAFGPDAPHTVRGLKVAARGAGKAVVVAQTVDRQSGGFGSQIYSTQLASGTWSAPVLHDETDSTGAQTAFITQPVLATNAAGVAVAAWGHAVTSAEGVTTPVIRAMTATAGGAFAPDADISGTVRWPQGFSFEPALAAAVSSTGESAVFWSDRSKIYAGVRPPGAGWRAPEAIPRQPPANRGELHASAAGGRYLVRAGDDLRLAGRSRPPVATITPPAALPVRDEPYRLSSADSFDPDRPTAAGKGITARAWDLDDDGAFDDGTGVTADLIPTTTGDHRVSLRVSDQAGDVRVARFSYTLQPIPAAVSFGVSPAEPLSGETVTFTDTSIGTDGGPVLSWTWYRSDRPFEPFGTERTAQTTFTVPGTYAVSLSVGDAYGGGSVTRDVTVRNRPPVAAYNPPGSTAVQALVLFDGSPSYDPDGPEDARVRRFEWDLDGDGTFETDQGRAPEAVAAYGQGGTVNVGLRVTDAFGGTGTVSHPLFVQPPGAAARAAERSAGARPVRTPAAVAAALAQGRRALRFRARRAGVLGVRYEASGSRRVLAAAATVFRRAGTQVVRVRSTRALRRARSVRVRVTWTPRGGRPVTVSRRLRAAR